MRRTITILISLAALVTAFLVIVNSSRYRKYAAGELHEEERTSDAMQALDFWTRSRAYPEKDIPPDKYYRAYQIARAKHRELSSVLTAGSLWSPIGPTNLHGRALSVALNPLNPNTVYVGTASGGLWRSYSGGLSGDWLQLKLGYPALGISAVVIDPTDTNVIFLGTGEVYGYQAANGGLVIRTMRGSYGIGILKTTDGGQTWTKSLDWSYNNQTGVEAMKMNPLNHSTIWAATTEGLYRTTNAGATWDAMDISGLNMVEDIVINTQDTTQVLVSIGDFNVGGCMILRTTDAGISWSPSTFERYHWYTGKMLLETYAAHPNVVYASAADDVVDYGALYRSTDFGTSWIKLYSPTNLYQVQGWYSHFVTVHPADSSKIVYASVNTIRSTNGGRTFTSSGGGYGGGNYADNHGYAHHPTNPNILYVVNDDGVYRSDDFGTSFYGVGTGMQTGQFYNGFSCSATDSLLAIGQCQDHIPGYRYLGSSTWDHNSVTDEVGWTAINQSNDNIMYAVDRNGDAIYKSNNRGASFFGLTGFDGSGGWNSPFVLSAANPNVLYLGDVRVHKSTNAGGGWLTTNSGNPLDGNPALSIAISATSTDTVYVGTAPVSTQAHIFRTTNGGTAWQDVTGTLPNRYPMDLAVDPQNSRTVYAALGGFGSGHLFKSTNAGTNWTDITGSLPDAPTTAIAVDPLLPNNVYVGNDLGVYVSTNGGTSWSEFSQGLPDAVIAADLVISQSNRALRVATHGNGVWERKLVGELPSNYVDYEVVALNMPPDGAQYALGSEISPLSAAFKSLSLQSQTDSFDVQYQILHGSTVLYSNTKRIAGLGAAEQRVVTFDGSFSPPDTGYYTIRAISMFSDFNSHDDTLSGMISAVLPPTISNAVVVKQYSSYTEITGGLAGPSGDDAQLSVGLPFFFLYDGYNYDSVQISTNGWLELGTGASGSLRGLSTQAQVGGYFNPGARADAERPTKVLGPWWADLNTSPSGQITYQTLGTEPDRIFVVQWKNVLAYYDVGSTSTYLNFQVRLYEASNVIDFSYGPVVAGAFPPSASGAAEVMKDYIGGDYRYYDVYARGTGLAGALTSDLTPLTDWPGQDSAYHIVTNGGGIISSYGPRWNIVSNPLQRGNISSQSIFPASQGRAFAFAGTYQLVDSLKPGKGYWLKFPLAAGQFIVGSSMSTAVESLAAGWNLIGSVDHKVPAPAGGIVASVMYGYSGGYHIFDSIVPGQGYWIKTNNAGVLTLGSHALPRANAGDLKAMSSITVSDRLGRSQTLYLAQSDAGTELEQYELPPLPPEGNFDVRFASQRMVESFSSGTSVGSMYPLQIQSPEYPLVISYSMRDVSEKRLLFEVRTKGTLTAVYPLTGKGSITISSGGEQQLTLKVGESRAVPATFALKQNYPNPFNPTTAIDFGVPITSRVSLRVYDMVGREVMKLAEGNYEPGNYTVNGDFSRLASGVYLYRLEAVGVAEAKQSFTQVKKMLMIK
ncbi:MAG: T9SS type A sorting domain-containing protein [Bacteroidota bacterium]|jgi:photosystem II stability/assembly factor-like uncharacterized protein